MGSLGMYADSEIEAAMRGASLALAQTAQVAPIPPLFRLGHDAALRTVATSLGLDPRAIGPGPAILRIVDVSPGDD